ncbi:hypothetical protein AX16_005634 [Volvariella volvacea WC 439]|nr:hypothetical protein AX16_005634 [Volvariella volvacea WC 439]
MAEPHWQELLRLRLTKRNAKEAAFAPIIEQYRRLAQHAKQLKEHNANVMRAMNQVRTSNSTLGSTDGEDSNPVRMAFINSLQSQMSALRDELAMQYKTSGQNAQRLVAMNETLREKEEAARIDSETIRKLRDELAVLRRKVDQHAELMSEKDRTVQILHDEISTLQLELGQIEERNQNLTKDNAKLLQRWLDAKQAEANRMNEANEFYEDMRTQHQAAKQWKETGPSVPANGPSAVHPSFSLSGNGDLHDLPRQVPLNQQSSSPASRTVDLTPNG